jgi:hypothetical protein
MERFWEIDGFVDLDWGLDDIGRVQTFVQPHNYLVLELDNHEIIKVHDVFDQSEVKKLETLVLRNLMVRIKSTESPPSQLFRCNICKDTNICFYYNGRGKDLLEKICEKYFQIIFSSALIDFNI